MKIIFGQQGGFLNFKNMELEGVVVGKEVSRFKYRWFGILDVKIGRSVISLYMSGNIAQWFVSGDKVILMAKNEPKASKTAGFYLGFDDYTLYKIYNGERFQVWPVFNKFVESERVEPVLGKPIYKYKIKAREAVFESAFESIAELEQFHYASQKDVVAIWRCDKCGELIRSNTKPVCPNCKTDKHVHILEIRGSTPASRFMVLELVDREPYEPKIVGYVRVDPPIPLMNRRLPNGEKEKNIREKVFGEEWFKPVFWPERIYKEKLRELKDKYSNQIARSKLWEEAKWEALAKSNTASARISRVVIHPDYRSDGLGQLAVRLALEWISERRIPEMRKRKVIVETIAMMARYNPFFEKVGFKYMWDTGSGRPALYYPLTDEAREKIENFLKSDPIAQKHKGKLCILRYTEVERFEGKIAFKNVSKVFESKLTLESLSPSTRSVLEAFGVRERILQRLVIREANFNIKSGEVVVIVGASGAGKTTLLRLLYGAINKLEGEQFTPTTGEIQVPNNVRASIMIPNEFEPYFGDLPIIEAIYQKTHNEALAVEILNRSGLSDAVLYRAKYHELSTGQKERAKLAYLLAEKPNMLLIDEFASHLDRLTAMRVARGLSKLARETGMTLVLITHRVEIIKALAPDKVIFVGYGTARVASREEINKYIE